MFSKKRILLASTLILVFFATVSWLLWPQNHFTNSLGMKFVKIPAGDFIMGDINENKKSAFNDAPTRDVRLSYDFFIQTTEVTQGQWQAIMNDNPSHYKGPPNLPVESVSYEEIELFLAWLNQKGEGIYRLPTEAEWEYAARASTPSAYISGNAPESANDYAWHKGNSELKTHPVGLKKPNSWGLFDMHGNVYEWVSDWYDNYPEGPAQNPMGPKTGINRVMRGGSFMFPIQFARSGRRHSGRPFLKNRGVGFRLIWSEK